MVMEEFTFTNLPEGYYTIIITNPSYAQSRAQNVKATDGETTRLEMIQMVYAVPDWPAVSPVLKITGVSDGDIIDTTTSLSVSAWGEKEISLMSVRIGNKHNLHPPDEVSSQSYMTVELAPSDLPSGSTYLYIVAYDENNNRTETTLNINPQYGQTVTHPTGTLSNLNPFAVTYGESMGYYKEEMDELEGAGASSVFTAPNGSIVDISALPDNTTCYIEFTWKYTTPPSEDDPSGFRVYRSSAQSGPYTLVGETDFNNSVFYDADPAFIYPGQTFYYKVSAFNAGGEGPLSDVSPAVTVLDVFRVYLTSPADNGTGVSTTPTLEWSISGEVGEVREYEISLWPYNGGLRENFVVTNSAPSETSISLSGLTVLKQNELYQWDVLNATAYGSKDLVIPNYYHAVSIPSWHYFQSLGQPVSSSNNGSFTFTTNP